MSLTSVFETILERTGEQKPTDEVLTGFKMFKIYFRCNLSHTVWQSMGETDRKEWENKATQLIKCNYANFELCDHIDDFGRVMERKSEFLGMGNSYGDLLLSQATKSLFHIS